MSDFLLSWSAGVLSLLSVADEDHQISARDCPAAVDLMLKALGCFDKLLTFVTPFVPFGQAARIVHDGAIMIEQFYSLLHRYTSAARVDQAVSLFSRVFTSAPTFLCCCACRMYLRLTGPPPPEEDGRPPVTILLPPEVRNRKGIDCFLAE